MSRPQKAGQAPSTTPNVNALKKQHRAVSVSTPHLSSLRDFVERPRIISD